MRIYKLIEVDTVGAVNDLLTDPSCFLYERLVNNGCVKFIVAATNPSAWEDGPEDSPRPPKEQLELDASRPRRPYPLLMRTKELCRVLGISQDTLFRWYSNSKVTGMKGNGYWNLDLVLASIARLMPAAYGVPTTDMRHDVMRRAAGLI